MTDEISLQAIFEKDFLPEKLTKLQLRSLLGSFATHLSFDDLPPVNAKKEVYLQLFDKHILKRKNQLLKSNKNVKANGKGIVVVADDGSLATTNGTPIKKSPKKRDLEFNLSSGYFSDDNPFQSPPTSTTTNKSSSRAPKSVSPRSRSPLTKNSRQSSRSRSPVMTKLSKKQLLGSSPKISSRIDKSPDTLLTTPLPSSRKMPGPAMQLPIPLSELSPPKLPLRKNVKLTSPASVFQFKSILKLLFYVFLIALSMILSISWSFFQSHSNQICAHSQFNESCVVLNDLAATELLLLPTKVFMEYIMKKDKENLLSYCWKCPSHADLGTAENGYICHPGFAPSVKSLIQFYQPICSPDPTAFSTVQRLCSLLEDLLGSVLGKLECGEDVTDYLNNVAGPLQELSEYDQKEAVHADGSMSIRLLGSLLAKMEGSNLSKSKVSFPTFWNLTQQHLSIHPKDYHLKFMHQRKSLKSTLAKKSLSCKLRQSVTLFFQDYWLPIALFIVLSLMFFILLRSSRKTRRLNTMSGLLYERVLDILLAQEQLYLQDPTKNASTIPIALLKDALLNNNTGTLFDGVSFCANLSPWEKSNLWKRVVAKVHSTANIRESTSNYRGESFTVWEWIGPSILSPNKKDSRF